MTEPFDDEYGDRLRRALNTEAEAVTPSPEGLEQIRTKITKRQERRFGLWYAAPWLRPLVAVAAAIFISTIAISASPALKNLVQTGHFSAPDPGDGTGGLTGDHSLNPSAPGSPGHSNPNLPAQSPLPHPTLPGKHTTKGSCAPGEAQVGPTGPVAATGSAAPEVTVTCQPSGGPTGVPPTSEVPTAPPPTVPTNEDPTSGAPAAPPEPSVAPSG